MLEKGVVFHLSKESDVRERDGFYVSKEPDVRERGCFYVSTDTDVRESDCFSDQKKPMLEKVYVY